MVDVAILGKSFPLCWYPMPFRAASQSCPCVRWPRSRRLPRTMTTTIGLVCGDTVIRIIPISNPLSGRGPWNRSGLANTIFTNPNAITTVKSKTRQWPFTSIQPFGRLGPLDSWPCALDSSPWHPCGSASFGMPNPPRIGDDGSAPCSSCAAFSRA